MQKVSNKACIRRLSSKTLRTAKIRNLIAILAIMLTTVLFTSLFTIAMSINKSFQEQNFRQAGGSQHGGFKDVTHEQIEELTTDPLIQEFGVDTILGLPGEEPFLKSQVQVQYMDEKAADMSFCTPTEGSLPKEGTLEAATDTRVLELLGVEPKIGETFILTYDLGFNTENPQPVTQTFTLSGWWEYDAAGFASNVIVPLSYTNAVLSEYESREEYDMTGRSDLIVMLRNSLHIREDLEKVLEKNGYQCEDESADNYIKIGVNWGYTGAQISRNIDWGTVLGVVAALLLIVFSGYLIIYNIFRISVMGDIRFYGLLKTVGTTGRQLKRIIRRQAMLLSGIGIPLGLLTGGFVGAKLVPLVMSTLSTSSMVVSLHPLVFVISALFAFITVLLSCRRPGKIAGKVSPIEAVRYTEGQSVKKKEKKGISGGKVWRMALSNLGNNKSKTCLVLISLSLSVVLLNATYTFTNGFDMDKYLRHWVCTDFIVGSAGYFQPGSSWQVDHNIMEDIISDINQQEGIVDSGRIYGQTTIVQQYRPEELIRNDLRPNNTEEDIESYLSAQERDEEGNIPDWIQLYGMEEFPISKLTTIDGDLSKLPQGDQIAAVVLTDDYGKPEKDTNHYQVGDKIKIRYVDEFEYIDSRTGEPIEESTPNEYIKTKYLKVHEKIYTVCARVTMLNSMDYRSYGSEEMILPADEFQEQTQSSDILTYLLDTTEDSNIHMEEFLRNYTEHVETAYDYESKQSYIDEFNGLRSMFLIMGSILSLIIGMIGVLNFVNAIVTSVMTRKREFAILQAVGMTGKQLKKMLILEGCAYGIGAVSVAFLLNLICAPLFSNVLESMFWFYSYKFTIIPIISVFPLFLLFGIIIPLVAYQAMVRNSLVDRIRGSET